MKYKDKTASFTQLIVRLCCLLLLALTVVYPFVVKYEEGFDVFTYLGVFGNDIVFDNKNIKLLNLLTGCCAYATVVGVVSFIVLLIKTHIPFDLLIVLPSGEAFMTLVVRVVRNVFKKAIEIKEENDLVV